jgi:tetratricopeptide (TPR) repeat protein
MRTIVAVLLHVLLVPPAWAAPRIAFDRLLPPAQDLGRVSDVGLVSAPSDPNVELFIERFIEHANRSGGTRFRDARATPGPAELHLVLKMLQCDTADREGEGSVRDADGNRVKRRHFWVDAVCAARIDVMSRYMKPLSTFYAKGEGRSSRVDALDDDQRADALTDAVKAAATEAAGRVTPRRVRESIALDDTAPAFGEGAQLIAAQDFRTAREIWGEAVRKTPRSAPLHFNLGAVCEALGDRQAARLHYLAARELAPKEPRYQDEMKLFARRAE